MLQTTPTQIDLGHTLVFKRADGLIQVNGGNHEYNVSQIKEIHQSINQLNDGYKALVLLTTQEFTLIDLESKQFLSKPEAGQYSIAEAYVIQSLSQRLILNFLFKVMGTPVPAKFFTDIEAAANWLKFFEKN